MSWESVKENERNPLIRGTLDHSNESSYHRGSKKKRRTEKDNREQLVKTPNKNLKVSGGRAGGTYKEKRGNAFQ